MLFLCVMKAKMVVQMLSWAPASEWKCEPWCCKQQPHGVVKHQIEAIQYVMIGQQESLRALCVSANVFN